MESYLTVLCRWMGWDGWKTIQIWGIESGQLATTYTDYGDAQMFPYYSPEEGLIAAAVSKQKVEIWDVEQKEKIDTFEHRGDNWHVCFSGDGAQFGSCKLK